MKKRSDMKPGEMFVMHNGYGRAIGVLVVIDKNTEVDFWYGGRWFVGNAMPSLTFRMVNE